MHKRLVNIHKPLLICTGYQHGPWAPYTSMMEPDVLLVSFFRFLGENSLANSS
jgi:hypothetical protein